MKRLPPISRRKALRAAGVSLALPFLDAMRSPSKAEASTAASQPVRLAWIFFPNGTHAPDWLPEGEGKNWNLTPSLEPLSDHQQDIIAFRGLAQNNAASLGDGPGDHARSASAFLTGAHPFKTTGSKIRVGRSVDQVAADHLGPMTRLPSIELGTEAGRSAGSCDSGYACAYSNNISWRTESQPTSKEINPKRAFERLFGSRSAKPTDLARRQHMKQSILDMVLEQSQSLRNDLGNDDRRKLDEYLVSVREIEMRTEKTSKPLEFGNLKVSEPPEEPSDFREHLRLMYDLMVLAFRTDATRLATFMVANEGSNHTFPMLDISSGHHELSHHQNNKDHIRKIAKIDKFYTEQFAYFLSRLKETPDGDSNLLKNCLILYGGAISDGNRHDHNNLPILLAGQASGRVETGRLVRQTAPLNNLFLSMLECVDVHLEDFGDSTGRLRL